MQCLDISCDNTLVDEMLIVDEVPSVVTEFSGDSNAPQVDEVPRDISTIDEEPIGTKASKYMIELLN